MRDGLRAAHGLFITVVVIAALGVALCFPRLEDGRRIDALRSLETLAAELRPSEIEDELLQQVEGSAVPTLEEIVELVEGPGVKGLSAGDDRPQLFRAAPLGIATLGHVVEACGGGRQVTLDGPDLDALAVGLRWRIGRLGIASSSTLTGIRLGSGSAGGMQLTTEANVESHRLKAIEVRKAFVKARKRFHHYRDRAKRFKDRGASRTLQRKAAGKRREVFQEMTTAQLPLEAARLGYQEIAAKAMAFSPGKTDASSPGMVIIATLKRDSGKTIELVVPVPKVKRQAQLEAIAIAPELTDLSRSSLWPGLRNSTATEALPSMRAGLSWQLAGGDVGPLRLGGATVLQLFSLLLMLLLWRLSRRCRAVADAYDPFHHPGADLPRIGTGSAALDAALLVGPPIAITGLGTWALHRIDAQPLIALALGLAAIGLALVALQAWTRLRDLRADVQRTSLGPPAA